MTPQSQGAAETHIVFPFTHNYTKAVYSAMQESENSGKWRFKKCLLLSELNPLKTTSEISQKKPKCIYSLKKSLQ